MVDNSQRPIIIKKIKRGGHAHHGGAWKVAYADFVTAMMAFFLLLWLLSSVPQETLKGIADYFTPTIGLKDSMGIGFEGGQGQVDDGQDKENYTNPALINGAPNEGPIAKTPEQERIEREDAERIRIVEENLKSAVEDNKELQEYKDNINIKQTPEGLLIEIMDDKKNGMFKRGTAILEPYTQTILKKVIEIIRYIPNYISIEGHTDGVPSNNATYGNWELSADRANSVRKYIDSVGFEDEQIAKMVAKADHELRNVEDVSAPENRRLAIIILRHAVLSYNKQSAPGVLLSNPEKSDNGDYQRIKALETTPPAPVQGVKDYKTPEAGTQPEAKKP